MAVFKRTTGSKPVSRKMFVWAHVLTIIFHLVIAALVIYAAYSGSDNKTLLYTVGSILGAMSLLSLVPVLRYKPQ